MKREGLRANVRDDNERALKSLKHQLIKAEKSAKEQKMEKRYHMVRFVGSALFRILLTSRTTESYEKITTSRKIVQGESDDRSAGRN